MAIFKRWFGRRAEHETAPVQTEPPEIGPEEAVAGVEPASPVSDETLGDAEASLEMPETPSVGPSVPLPELSVPLKELTAYQRDPAYQNFLRRMKRPPGVAARRPRGPD